MTSCLVQLGNDSGEGVPNAWYLSQAPFGDQLIKGQRAQRQIIRGTPIGPRAIEVAPSNSMRWPSSRRMFATVLVSSFDILYRNPPAAVPVRVQSFH